MPAACSLLDVDYLIPVEVRVAFLSGFEAEEPQPLQYRLPKDAEADQKDTELVQVFHERTSVLHIASLHIGIIRQTSCSYSYS